jgi:hypothetical protein
VWGINQILEIFKDVFEQLYKWLVEPFTDIHTLRDLIFGQDGTEQYIFKTFKENEILNVYVPGVSTTTSIAAIFILMGIVYSGIRISSSGLNPSNRTALLEFLKDIFIVGIVVANIGTFYELIFKFNGAIVNVFAGTEDTLTDFTTRVDSNGGVDGFLGWIVIQLVLLGLALWANFYYMMRKLTLIILMILGPIMMALWLIPQYKGITMGWLKEFTGTVFVQAIHACTFWVVASLSMNQNQFIPSVILYVIFIPVSESIRGLFGLGGQMNSTLAKVGAGFGMASLAGMAGSIKGALGDKSLTGALKEAYQGVRNHKKDSSETSEGGKSTVGANTGTDTGTTTRAEKMLRAGQISSKAGKAVFGMAGSIAGSPMGPIGAIAGGTAGMLGGGAIGGLSGRVGSAAVMGVGNRFKKGVEGAKDEAKKLTDSAGMNDLAESMAQKDTDQWISSNKEGLEKDLKKRHPEASPSRLKELYNHDVAQKHKEHKNNALNTLKDMQGKDGTYGNASDLAEQSANNLTNAWAKENQNKEFQKIKQENPNITENEAIAKWNKKLGDKKQEFLQLANDTASGMSNGIDLKHISINKANYAGQLASKVFDNEKTRFKMDNPDLSESEVDLKFNKSHGQQKQAYISALNNASDSVKGQSLMNKGHINRDHFASMMATNMTAKNKDGQIAQMVSDGFTTEEANKHWDTVGKQRNYADNYGKVKEKLASYAPGKVVIPSTTGGQIFKGVASVAGGTAGFVKGFTGINEISSFLGDTKLGKAVVQGATGIATGVALNKMNMQQALTQAPTLSSAGTEVLKGSIGMVVGGASSGSEQFKKSLSEVHVPQNLMERQAGFKNAVAFGSGMIGGINGYQKGANFGMTHNPYNNLVQQGASEVSEIAQMATRGTVQLVTTDNQSYIQVRDKSGKTQIVSRQGSGDSSLNKGEIVYQDLNVQDGAIVPKMIDGTNSSAYMVDSGGGKIPLNRSINVNPNRLVSNRNVPVQTPVDVQPYSQQVENGQYYVDDVVAHSQQNIRMVTERNRSYIVAQDSRGVEHRISPYGQGDTKLSEGETVYTDCQVSNKRLKTERVYTINQETNVQTDVEHRTNVDPNELLPKKQNPRLNQRNERETLRHHQGV